MGDGYGLLRTQLNIHSIYEMSWGKFGETPTLTRNRKSRETQLQWLKSDYLIHL
jgi:hypothetical protein